MPGSCSVIFSFSRQVGQRYKVLKFAAFAALLGGIVVWGSNGSTANEADAELAKAETDRRALIGLINLRVIAERPTLH